MVAPLIPIAIGVGVAAVGAGRQFMRNLDKARKADTAKARAREAYLRLGFAVETLDAKGDAVAAEHLVAARRQWAFAREVIMDTHTQEAADAVYEVIAAGLEQVTLARIALGLEQPKELAPPPGQVAPADPADPAPPAGQ